MKKFNSMNMTLFDSLSAEFKLSIETSFSRKTDDGGVRNLVYITDATSTSAGGYGVMNPSIFLVFAHKGEKPTDDKKIYTSYPHLYRIRTILKTLCDWMSSPDAYVETDMGLAVHPNFAQPMSISNIFRGSKWISFSLSVIETGTDTVVTRHPGIKIEVSEAAGQYSILTEDELYTLYGIISTLDLANIAVSMSLAYLDANSNSGYAKPAASAPATAPTSYGRNAVPRRAFKRFAIVWQMGQYIALRCAVCFVSPKPCANALSILLRRCVCVCGASCRQYLAHRFGTLFQQCFDCRIVQMRC